ncbi:FecR family protein [Flavitalea antarctica]
MDKSALHRFFLNESSPAERQEVISWLLNPQNDLLIKIWMKDNWDLISPTDTEKEPGELDAQKMWNDLSEKLFDREVPAIGIAEAPVKNIPARATGTRWIAAAACLIFALGFFVYSYRQSILYVSYETRFGEVREFNLGDGSHVVLNANSRLLVPRWGFTKGDRKVELEGEAAFDVTHMVNHQKFLVTTNSQLNVEVLGTEFLLYSRNQTNKVILKEGSVKVRFKDEQREPVLMKPGDVVTADKTGSLSVKHQQPISNLVKWKDHRFIFDSTTLNEVITHISDFFGDTIIISGKMTGNKTVTGSFGATSALEALTIIAEIYNLEIEQTTRKIILREKTPVFKTQ